MEKRKLYVLIDKSLKPVYGCVQGGHVVAQWMLEHPYSREWQNDYLISRVRIVFTHNLFHNTTNA